MFSNKLRQPFSLSMFLNIVRIFSKKFPTKSKDDLETKKTTEDKFWFCALYNRNKCQHIMSHTEVKMVNFIMLSIFGPHAGRKLLRNWNIPRVLLHVHTLNCD